MSTETDEPLRVRVEIPKGSRNKYEVNPDTGDIELDRRLHAPVTYPTEYGYVPGTLAEDGDEVDAMVCVTEPTFPGCVIPAKPIAVLRITKDGQRNDKVLCVPLNDPSWNGYGDVDDLPQDLGAEIMHFFSAYTGLEEADWDVEGWGSAQDAAELLAAARQRRREAE
jgi:inorganic pyrophosphatase